MSVYTNVSSLHPDNLNLRQQILYVFTIISICIYKYIVNLNPAAKIRHGKSVIFGGADVSKDKVLTIRIDPDLKKAAKKAAESENRSLSNWVTWLIQREIKRVGRKGK